MVTEEYSIIRLVASDNMMLTNGKIYCREVFLGPLDSPDNWYEIPEEECPAEGAVV